MSLTLKQVFRKTETFLKKLEYRFKLRVIRLKAQHFHKKLLCKKPMLTSIERGVQNGRITRNFATDYFIFLEI